MSTAVETKDQGLAPVFIDLGKKKKKMVKRLRNGKGKLAEQIQSTLADLREGGTIAESAQPVIIVIREKKKRSKRFLL